MKKKAKIILIILGGILYVAIMVVVTMFMTSGSNNRKYQNHMEVARQYLDELQYEQAIAEYEQAIEIDPKNPEAYQALAELFVQVEDYASAIMVLGRGLEQIESGELGDYLEKVQANLEEKKAQGSAQERFEEQEELSESSKESVAENGLREETIYWDGGSYHINEYDENRNRLKETWYNVDGTIKDYYVYEYDVNGDRLMETWYNADGTIRDYYVYEYEYDESGRLVKEAKYDASGLICDYSEYDGKSKLVKCYDKGSFWRIEYDTKGSVIKEISYFDYDETMIDGYWIYEYDENGNCEKETWYDSGGAHEYVYDEYDNW